jgi:hypothetical protein
VCVRLNAEAAKTLRECDQNEIVRYAPEPSATGHVKKQLLRRWCPETNASDSAEYHIFELYFIVG